MLASKETENDAFGIQLVCGGPLRCKVHVQYAVDTLVWSPSSMVMRSQVSASRANSTQAATKGRVVSIHKCLLCVLSVVP